MGATSAIGNICRCVLCAILFVTFVVQQARNVFLSLQNNFGGPLVWHDDTTNSNSATVDTTTTFLPPSSSWMGNYWIPPPNQPLYSGLDFQRFFSSDQSVLMIGDTWLQYSYAILYAILNNKSRPSNIRVVTLQEAVDHSLYNESAKCSYDHGNWTHCWGLPSSETINEPYFYDFVKADCLSQAIRVLESSMQFDKYKLIVLGFGSGCTEFVDEDALSVLRSRVLHLSKRHDGPVILWRTTPNLVEAVRNGPGWEAVLTQDHTKTNHHLYTKLQGLPILTLDWAAMLQPKAQIRPLPVPQNLVPPTSQAAQLGLLQQMLHNLKAKNAVVGTSEVEVR